MLQTLAGIRTHRMLAVNANLLRLDLVHVLNLPLRQEALLRRRLVHLNVRQVELSGLDL